MAAPAIADGIDVGGTGDSNIVTNSTSEFNNLGELITTIDAAAPEDVVGGSGGTFAFPVNITVYGLPSVRIPSDPTVFEEYCFVVRYSTSHIDEVSGKQVAANGGFELSQDRDYLEPAEAQHRLDMEAWEQVVEDVEDENERRLEEDPDATLLSPPPAPEPLKFPLDVCEGEPSTVPDFVPAFDAAARAVRDVDPPELRIAPGHGITGLAAYLETQRDLTIDEPEATDMTLGYDLSGDPLDPTPVPGTVSFQGEATFDVDWGDGTVQGPFSEPGAPYGAAPEAAITHTYAETGDHVVSVTDSWTVSMRITWLGETYTFTHRESLGPYELDFSVDEVRSVRER